MRPLKVLFVCALAALGIAAIASAAASAAQPEFRECNKVKKTGAFSDRGCSMTEPKHKGKYELGEVTHECVKVAKVNKHFTGHFTDKKCTVESATSEGKYERQKGVGGGKQFKEGAQSVALYLESEFIDCKSGAKARGLVTGPKTVGEVTMSLKGCAYGGEEACGNTSLEEIETVPLSGTLGYIDAATHEVGLDLAPEGGGAVFMEFTCHVAGGVPVTVRGSVVMTLTGDLNTLSQTFDLSSSGAKNFIPVESLEGGPRDILEWESGLGGSEPMPLSADFTGEGESLEVSG